MPLPAPCLATGPPPARPACSRYTRQFIATGLLRNHQADGPCEAPGTSSSGGQAAPAAGTAEAAQRLLEAAFEAAGVGIQSSGLELRESGSTAVVCHVEPGRCGEGRLLRLLPARHCSQRVKTCRAWFAKHHLACLLPLACRRVTAAWCGDSRAVLGLHVERPDAGPAVLVHPLTEDHRPNRRALCGCSLLRRLGWLASVCRLRLPPPAPLWRLLPQRTRPPDQRHSVAAQLPAGRWSGLALRRRAGRWCSWRMMLLATLWAPSACAAATCTWPRAPWSAAHLVTQVSAAAAQRPAAERRCRWFCGCCSAAVGGWLRAAAEACRSAGQAHLLNQTPGCTPPVAQTLLSGGSSTRQTS